MNPEQLRTVDDIHANDGLAAFYLISADPRWKFYDSAACPAPISAWLAEHCPEVSIEQVEIAKLRAAVPDDGVTLSFSDSAGLPRPIFYLKGLTDDQAEVFAKEWSKPELQPPEGEEDFYFARSESCAPGFAPISLAVTA